MYPSKPLVWGTLLPLNALVVLVLLTLPSPTTAETPALIPRVAPSIPARTTLGPMHDPGSIVLKFSEGWTGVRLKANPSPSLKLSSPHIGLLNGVLKSHSLGIGDFHRLFTRPERELDAERETAQRRSGRALADLNLYYRIDLPDGVDAARLCDDLNALPFVELAQPSPRPAPPPRDIPPSTPDFTSQQQYREGGVPPEYAGIPGITHVQGIGVTDVMSIPGWDGSGLTVVDIEYTWVLDHEDLELPAHANIDAATAIDPFPDEGSHGSAVLGVIGARDNGYGVTGISPGATLRVAPQYTVEHLFNIERAISLATGVLRPGDVILLENQICVCELVCDDATDEGFGPSEYFQPVYDATATATALGITVVAAAGNGGVDLDSSRCGGKFDRSVRDSRAILVGAGDSTDRSRRLFSTYGSRVDVQGWGDSVVTTGYGDLFDPQDVRQRYTSIFGGTSSAASIVTGAVLSIQGIARAAGLPPLSPKGVRSLLVRTGTAQGGDRTEHIGPLPNLPAAVDELLRESRLLPLVRRASHPAQQGFIRIINHSAVRGRVFIVGIDDAGSEYGAIEVFVDALASVHLNSQDLENGNPSKELYGGLGVGEGDWRLRLSSTLDIEPLSYMRTADGFVTKMQQLVPAADYRFHHVRFFNPGENRSTVSYLRLINVDGGPVTVTIEGRDDAGEPAPGGAVHLTLEPGQARTLSAQALESGEAGLIGRLGDGDGKWQLFISASGELRAMSLLQSATGHLTNLSTASECGPGESEQCDPSLICGQAFTCVDGLLYPTTCGPSNCDTPVNTCHEMR